jgi:decaprenylphospho-beta-D-erythro-pentofuranosid-2-ulose 2-reductase
VSSRRAGAGGRRVVVLGGSSEIALAIVLELERSAPREVALIGHDPKRLEGAAHELLAAGCGRVITREVDARDTDAHAAVVASAVDELGGADIVVLAVGVLGEPGGLPADVDGASDVLRVNALGAGSLLMHAAARLRADGGGTMVVLSSVAAERPRRANPAYGASKAALDGLAQALGDALHDDGVRVLVVRPGFVHTRMTRGLQAAPLACSPQDVAREVGKGLEGDARTVWVPAQLRYAMLVMRMLPRAIFRRIER